MSSYLDDTGVENLVADVKTMADMTYVSLSNVDSSLSTSSTNPIENAAVATVINTINNFISRFNKQLTMSNTAWKSGTCTITDISKYNVIIAITGSEPILVARRPGSVSWRGSLLTGSGTQYGKLFYFSTASATSDVCTYGNGVQLTHTPSGNHSSATTGLEINAVYGLIPA